MKLILLFGSFMPICMCADILMATLGGTKSHKIPFWELAKGLIPRGHNITFLNGFPADFSIEGLEEITPVGLVEYIRNYTNWDLLGARMRGEMPISAYDILRYSFQVCDAMLNDAETKDLLNRRFDLLILDGAYPECVLGMAYRYGVPFMYINTVGFYTGSMSIAGNPAPFSVTPSLATPYTDDMTLYQRSVNTALSVMMNVLHGFSTSMVQHVVNKHLGEDIPHVYHLARNVSFILQNGHATVTYPRPLLPNVAEIACIHCKPAAPLPKDLEDFIAGAGESGFIYISMGSSVKAANMPEGLRRLLLKTFSQLPYRVLWKWEASSKDMADLPPNVRLGRWLPQQDILGHRKLRAFITHGGLLSMFETVYHGTPVVTMPVFCDHDSNSAKAEVDGYALKLYLETLTSEKLLHAIHKVIHDPKYRSEAKKRQKLLRDQRTTPLETAIYWTEYVLRYNGAYHLQTPARNLGSIQYYGFDVIGVFLGLLFCIRFVYRKYTRTADSLKLVIRSNKKVKAQ